MCIRDRPTLVSACVAGAWGCGERTKCPARGKLRVVGKRDMLKSSQAYPDAFGQGTGHASTIIPVQLLA
eukprot:1794761-Prorocentrum_lima.AAC.1